MTGIDDGEEQTVSTLAYMDKGLFGNADYRRANYGASAETADGCLFQRGVMLFGELITPMIWASAVVEAGLPGGGRYDRMPRRWNNSELRRRSKIEDRWQSALNHS